MINTIQKTIVAWAFNQIAHYYFDNVNISQLHIALEKGEVELEDLIIKREALRHLKIPVDVTYGVVGKLTLKLPLLTILTDPRQVKINILLENISIYLSNDRGLTRIYLEKCNLDIDDEASNSMQLVVVDFNKCLIYIIDDTTGFCAIPIIEFSLEDCRILLVLGKNQRNGFIYGKIGCDYYNRGTSTWDSFLDPWPFNLSWQFDLTEIGQEERKIAHRKISLKSDEIAEFHITSAFLEICDFLLLRFRNFKQPEPIVRSIPQTPSCVTTSLLGTIIATLTAPYGFEPPKNYKLSSYNHNVNLAERIAAQAKNLFNNHGRKATSDIDLLCPGFKLTLIDKSKKEFVEALVENIVIKWNTNAREEIIDCSVQDIRIENLMAEFKAVMLDRVVNFDESMNPTPAIRLIMDRIPGNSFGTTLFKQVQLSMCEFVLNIEERLILKLVEFLNYKDRRPKGDMENVSTHLDKTLHPEIDRHPKYYFDLLRIDLSSIRLSVFSSSNLNDSLQKLKSFLGLQFFGFEDAQIQLEPYFQMNLSRNLKGVFESVTRFYKRQIIEQTPRIVGQQIQSYLRFRLPDLFSTIYDEVYNKLFG